MIGMLPHNHGVLYVLHTVDDDQACLRTDRASSLGTAAGRRRVSHGVLGKWHIERSGQLADFGWQVSDELSGRPDIDISDANWSLEKILESPSGYHPMRFYGVFDVPPEKRDMGKKQRGHSNFWIKLLEEMIHGAVL